jgi:molybdate transport system substrate-binding protein
VPRDRLCFIEYIDLAQIDVHRIRGQIGRTAMLETPRLSALAFFVAVTFGAISPSMPIAFAQDRVTVFAAASLQNAVDAITDAWAQDGHEPAVVSYAGSSALARQIEDGAPADIFISADLDWMEHLSGLGLTRQETETSLLGNRLVLVAPADSTVEIAIEPGFGLAAALDGGRLAMADVEAVPAGRYGRAALEALGVWEQVRPLVAQSENVRAALNFVALGEAPLGIVYETDAVAEPAVRVVGIFPEGSHPPIVYPAALLASSDNAGAEALFDFLRSDRARALFEEQGFTVLIDPQD